jgi:hypothetical protein
MSAAASARPEQATLAGNHVPQMAPVVLIRDAVLGKRLVREALYDNTCQFYPYHGVG